MILILCILFFFIGLFSLIPLKIDNNYKYFFLFLSLFFFLIAAFREPGIDRDYLTYVKNFNNLNKQFYFIAEPSFKLIGLAVKSLFFNNVLFLFIIYALLAISIKVFAIKQLSEFWFLSLLLFLSYSFVLHDMTQIRVGVAVGFLLLCIKPLYERNFILFLTFACLAFFFHYSAIFVFFLWFLNPLKINIWIYGILILCSFIFSYFHFYLTNLLYLIPFKFLQIKLLAYKYEQGTYLNILNFWQLMRCLISLVFLWKYRTIQNHNPYTIIIVKIYIFSVISFFLLADIPVFASRISDMFGIVDIVALPFIIYVAKPKFFGRLFVVLIAFSYFFLNLFYNKILT